MGEIIAIIIIIAFFGLFGYAVYRSLKTTNPMSKEDSEKSDSAKK